ncbi:MAG: hypothetical protein G01um101493_391 [Microgenomates group bacterium Gr01-1014_93]|nr:MAG: hypothetical protein G01um101493_391 [Microgenomates group bacterium Gr01-1014_93]
MNKIILIAFILLLFVITPFILIFSPFRIIGPSRISGGNPGKYQAGQIVWSVKRALLGRKIVQGDVVKYNNPNIALHQESVGTFIGEVVGLPGKNLPENAFDLEEQPVKGQITAGSYLIEKNYSGKFWLVPEDQIKEVVVLP